MKWQTIETIDGPKYKATVGPITLEVWEGALKTGLWYFHANEIWKFETFQASNGEAAKAKVEQMVLSVIHDIVQDIGGEVEPDLVDWEL